MDDKATNTKCTTRTINHLPPPSLTDYSPYTSLEFNLSVQEYCRNKNNHISHKSNSSQKTAKQRTNEYNSINAPFNKVIRSTKVVVSGDVAVGKTSLVNRFGHDIYTNKYQTTIGVDFDIQKFNILGQPFLLQVSVRLAEVFGAISIHILTFIEPLDLGHSRTRAVQMYHKFIL